jgi:hypothetical protein
LTDTEVRVEELALFSIAELRTEEAERATVAATVNDFILNKLIKDPISR